MKYELFVENIKCGGCANTITQKLNKLANVSVLEVIVEEGKIVIEGTDASRGLIVTTLKNLGYPEVNSVEGLEALKVKAKSFVSCAIGKIN
ncbi:MAG TPA: heavy-metal-associated domain-containing protein [Pseudobdellovibrionaceae bacterium]|nr:heavy-metal-associated domain-containing protein [Pseudobdellovibrionaceae bacterium]